MNRFLLHILLIILATSCTQSRYGRHTIRVQNHSNTNSEVKSNYNKTPDNLSVISLKLNSTSTLYLGVPQAKEQTNLLHIKMGNSQSITTKSLHLEQEGLASEEFLVKLDHRSQLDKNIESTPQDRNGSGKSILNVLGTMIVVFLFLAALAWLGTVLGLPFWTVFWVLLGIFLFALLFSKPF